jgi:hypothetical protein
MMDSIVVHHSEYATKTVPLKGEADIRTFLMPPYGVTVNASFKLYNDTGNDGIVGEHTGSPLRAWMRNGVLHVNGLTPGLSWRVYNLLGQPVFADVATAGKAEILLASRGIYIVISGNETLKVVY